MPKNPTNEVELDDLELEMKRLTLIKLRFDVQKEQQRQANADRVSRTQEQSLREARLNEKYRRDNCPHRKGGKNIDGINRGKDPMYSIFIHTYATGEIVVLCTRCGNEWRKPPAELRRLDPEEYKTQIKAYITALEWPTDNEPGGTQLFNVEPTDTAMLQAG